MDLKTTSNRNAALTAGISIIAMSIFAGFAFGYVHQTVIHAENSVGLIERLQTQESLFRMGIFSWLLILIADILAAWGLYIYLKPVNENLSLLTGWMRVFYAAILGMAISQQIAALNVLNGVEALQIGSVDQIDAQLFLLLEGFLQIWSMGLIIFGIHLLGLGYLAFRSGFVPKIWGILILIAAVGYLLVHTGELVFVDFEAAKGILEMIFTLPMVVGELGLGIWLVSKGGR